MNNFGKFCRIFLLVDAEKVDQVRSPPPPAQWYYPECPWVVWKKKLKRMINVKYRGSKTSTLTDTHADTVSPNTIHMLYTLETIKYANASSPTFDKDRQSQISVLHTQVPSSKQQGAATPASGYLITLLKKFQCNHLQKWQRQGR